MPRTTGPRRTRASLFTALALAGSLFTASSVALATQKPLLEGTTTSAASLADHPFQAALNYTVQIKTTIQEGFNDEKRGTSLGAGFLIDRKRGWIMTNAHVVGRSPSVSSVAFHDQDGIPARKVFVDPHLDMAILAVDPALLPRSAIEAHLQCDSAPDVGDPVGTMGHPSGFAFTATRGIVSGVSRRFETELLQIDAPINPGNSGGPLIDLQDGKVIGINTAMLKGAQNTNFAIASVYLCPVVHLLAEGRDPSPPRLPWVDFKDYASLRPLKVAKVYEPTLTHLEPGDQILAINGKPAPDHETPLLSMLRGVSWPVTFTVKRQGRTMDLQESLPRATLLSYQKGFEVDGALIGTVDAPLPDEIKASTVGVHAVDSGSIAENLELQKSDFIIAVNDRPVTDLDHLRAVFADAQAHHQSVRLTLQRFSQQGGSGLFVYLEKTLPVRDLHDVMPDLPAMYLSPAWGDTPNDR